MAAVVHPRAWLDHRRARHEADAWIARGLASPYAWRELRGETIPGATPLRRAALRPHLSLFEQLERRLLDDSPVSAAGMLAVDDLLTSPGSPLFAEDEAVEAVLVRVLDRLGVH